MNNRLALSLTGLGALLLPACGGASGGGTSSQMVIVDSSNGFGKLLPHRVFRADSEGMPTNVLVEITRFDDLANNVTQTNPILPPVEWPTEAVLPNGEVGEITVRGPQATREYYGRPSATASAKIEDGAGFWHRMGDVG